MIIQQAERLVGNGKEWIWNGLYEPAVLVSPANASLTRYYRYLLAAGRNNVRSAYPRRASGPAQPRQGDLHGALHRRRVWIFAVTLISHAQPGAGPSSSMWSRARRLPPQKSALRGPPDPELRPASSSAVWQSRAKGMTTGSRLSAANGLGRRIRPSSFATSPEKSGDSVVSKLSAAMASFS